MVIIEDTRQKQGLHQTKNDYWSECGDTVIRCKLAFGDYAEPPKIAVDTKQNLLEIATNMCGAGAERKRFREECKAAKNAGCKLVFLIEYRSVKEPAELIGRKIRLMSKKIIEGEQLYTAMVTMSERYGCTFEFCDPKDAGQRIKDILAGGKNGHIENNGHTNKGHP